MPSKSNIYFTEFSGDESSQVPVILLHGAGSSHLTWPAAIRRMKGFNVFALDLPGHGHSVGTGFHDIKSYSNSIMDFLSAIGCNRAFLIGHSMGAAIALQMAFDHPKNTVGLGLIAAAASFKIRQEFIDQFGTPATAAAGLKELNQRIAPQKENDSWFPAFQQASLKTRSSLWYADLRACASFDIRKKLFDIKTPALVLAGSKDKMVPFADSKFLSKCLPNARMIPFYNNGHMLMLEEPQVVSKALGDFLNEYKQ
jgi:pimeloyl-ACP methyl ester carboxylesterase